MTLPALAETSRGDHRPRLLASSSLTNSTFFAQNNCYLL